MAKDLVILMDGTWNNSTQPDEGDSGKLGYTVRVDEESTNIARMWHLLAKSPEQQVVYIRGIGTDGNPLDKVDGAFGKEAVGKVNEAYNSISKSWQTGDGICIFGFSRGAATARMLAKKLHDEGIGNVKPVPVRFLGLFDTVASMGIPELMIDNFSNIDSYQKKFHDRVEELAIPSSVKRVVHLVAKDEDRSVFAPTLVILESPNQATTVDETWFGGNHGDIGGGWKDETETDKDYRRRMITLRYMLEQPHCLKLIPQWEDHGDVKVDPTYARCGTKHCWDDYSFSTRITGRLVRSLTDLPAGAKSPATLHPSATK